MILKFKKYGLLVGLLFGAVGIVTAQTSNSVVTFSVDMSTNIANGTFTNGVNTVSVAGTFNGWSQFGLVQSNSSDIYTNTLVDTNNANGGVIVYQYYISDVPGGEQTADFNNRAARLPATSGGSLVLPTPFYADLGAPVTNYVTFQVDMSEQIALGLFTNGSSTVVVQGNFNGWNSSLGPLTNDLNIIVTNANNIYTTNVYVGIFAMGSGSSPGGGQSPWAANDFKYLENGNYEGVALTNQDSGGNRFFAFNPNSNVTLPVVFYGDAPYAPSCQVTLAVNMSVQLAVGNWTPSDGIFCAGINSDWNNDTVNTMTNNPADPNTNDYYATFTVGQESSQQYKFTYNGPSGTVYENPSPANQVPGGNRGFNVPLGLTSTNLPTVFFSDEAFANDFLLSTQQVTFTVNMTNAVEYPSGSFDPSSDQVYVNGAWLGWISWNPVDLINYQLTNNPPGSEVYSGVFPIQNGNSIGIIYKYSIDGNDNEAGFNDNRVRYIRTTATGSYSFPMDTFGNQYNEPAFGQLAVGPASAGAVPLSWLGAPNVQVQTTTNLTNSVWVTYPLTSGTNWTAGTYGTNGLVSATNWPAGSNKALFYRLLVQ